MRWYVWANRLPDGERITSAGMRYSNIDPDQETSADPRSTGVKARPRWNQSHQPLVAADAVVLVHHRVADLELGQVAQHPLDRGALFRGARAPAHDAGVELRFGDDRPAF